VFFSRWDLAHIDREQALQMRNEGKTDAQIAAHFSVSPKSVNKVLASG
jgi:DNA-binding CsgD family transcriptional regulator